MLKQHLEQKLQQKLTPQQIQMVKLLEIPTHKLEEKIKKELEENPVLEVDSEQEDNEESLNTEEDSSAADENSEETQTGEDDFSVEDYYGDGDDIPYYKMATDNSSKEEQREEIPFTAGTSLQDYLEDQLGMCDLDQRQYDIGKYILGNIDEDGYLRRRVQTIVDDLEFYENIKSDEQEVKQLLELIQQFDPPGIAARDLQECLLLQLNRKNDEDETINLAIAILQDHYEAFTHKHYEKIQHQLNVSKDQFKEALDAILKLNPKPATSFSDASNKSDQQIEPDFILENKDGQLFLNLNNKNMPNLSLNSMYVQMLEKHKQEKEQSNAQQDKDTIGFVRQRVNSAKWFIDAIKQRQNTLYLTMKAIIDYQREYFLEGDESKLKPMILKDIADRVGLDVSTVSRVVSSKYIQTHFGIFPLKYFFSEGIQTSSGEEVSTKEIKNILKHEIDNENKKKPLTDEKLSKILKDKGYNIARRTAAKYREQLGLPVARLRKEY